MALWYNFVKHTIVINHLYIHFKGDIMIHFNRELIQKTYMTIQSSNNYADIFKDLNTISATIDDIKKTGNNYKGDLLDAQIRQKYPGVDAMIRYANKFPHSNQTTASSPVEITISNLQQDEYGIICDTAIKIGLTDSFNSCIESID